MTNNFMSIPNDDKQNYHFCSLQLVVVMFGHFSQVFKHVNIDTKTQQINIFNFVIMHKLYITFYI